MASADDKDLAQMMRTELHELSQPLTTLRCRLELALMVSPPQARDGACRENDDDVSLHGAIQGALEDLCRVFVVVERMRKSVLAKAGK
jgi:hypothetical protein